MDVFMAGVVGAAVNPINLLVALAIAWTRKPVEVFLVLLVIAAFSLAALQYWASTREGGSFGVSEFLRVALGLIVPAGGIFMLRRRGRNSSAHVSSTHDNPGPR